MKIIHHKINKHELFWPQQKWNYGNTYPYGYETYHMSTLIARSSSIQIFHCQKTLLGL